MPASDVVSGLAAATQASTVGEAVRRAREEGASVIDLSLGAPSFDTDEEVKLAAIHAIRAGETRYTGAGGTDRVKSAVRKAFERDHDLVFAEDEVMVASGAKQVIFNALCATIKPGDEVIILAPHYPAYTQIVKLLRAKPVVASPRPGALKVDPDDLAALITRRTRWLIVNSPNNPSGLVYNEAEQRRFASVVASRPSVTVLSDEIYGRMVFVAEAARSFAAVNAELADRVLTVSGVSKTYGMTGWRIGYAGGSRELIAAMTVIQANVTTCPSSISQAAACAALEGSQEGVRQRVEDLAARRDLALRWLEEVALADCVVPDGGIYLFPSVADVLVESKLESDSQLAGYLLEEAGVATIPGSAFGVPGHLRLTFGADEDDVREGIRRLGRGIAQLRHSGKE